MFDLSGVEYQVAKATLDATARRVAAQLAMELDVALPVSEVDDATNFEEILKSGNSALVYQVAKFAAYPTPPKYLFEFIIGVKVREDNAGLLMTAITNGVQSVFRSQARFPLRDYNSETNHEVQRGTMLITSGGIGRLVYEKQQAIRLLRFQALAVVVHA